MGSYLVSDGYTRALPRCREQRGRAGCRGLVPPRGALAYLALTSCQACQGVATEFPPGADLVLALSRTRAKSQGVLPHGHAPRRCPSRHVSRTNDLAVRG